MSDRIKELAIQAGFVLWGDEDWKPANATIDWSSEYDTELARYTRLVVEECVKICTAGNIEKPMGMMYAKQIQKHFGIKNA